MNLSANLSASPNSLSASLGNGSVTLNGYVISLSAIDGGHRLSVSRGNETHFIDIADGEKGDEGRGIAGCAFNADYSLTLTFTDGTSFVTGSLRGEKGSSAWQDISNKPLTFTPEAHTHLIGDIQGLTAKLAALNGSGVDSAAYHLGFYIDDDGDLCQTD